MIDDVQVKQLARHPDSRGYFQENIRRTDDFFDGFGQWSISKIATGTIKAWHIHDIQTDYWSVFTGLVRAVLCDAREDSPTHMETNEFLLGDDQPPIILKIPPGVAHGIKVLQGPAYLSYITSHVYNPDDEFRRLYNDEEIGYDWFKETIT